ALTIRDVNKQKIETDAAGRDSYPCHALPIPIQPAPCSARDGDATSPRLPAGDRSFGREGRLGQADSSWQRARRRAWSSRATAARSSIPVASRRNSKAA